jgi:hypothetical protein
MQGDGTKEGEERSFKVIKDIVMVKISCRLALQI